MVVRAERTALAAVIVVPVVLNALRLSGFLRRGPNARRL